MLGMRYLFCGLLAVFTTHVSAADFTAANAMFDQRQKGFDHYEDTVKAYSDLVKAGNLTVDELFFAVAQMNRMHILYGDYVLRNFVKDEYKASLDLASWTKETNNLGAARKRTFDQCLQSANLISVDAPDLKTLYASDSGKYKAQFYYWRMACLALKIEASNVKGPLLVGDLIAAFNPSLALNDKTFEGGGVLRSLSGVKANPLAVVFGISDKQGALDILIGANSKILELPKHPADVYERGGRQFFNNYRYIARAFLANQNKADALKYLQIGESNIDETLEILAEDEEDSYTPTPGNIFELSLERDRILFEAANI
jgi:hypothetical protein